MKKNKTIHYYLWGLGPKAQERFHELLKEESKKFLKYHPGISKQSEEVQKKIDSGEYNSTLTEEQLIEYFTDIISNEKENI